MNVSWSIAILFGWFLERPKMWQNMDPRTPYLSPKYFNQYKRQYVDILGTSFSYLRIWTYANVGRHVYRTFSTCGFVCLREREIVETWKCWILKSEFWKLIVGHLDTLQLCKVTIWRLIVIKRCEDGGSENAEHWLNKMPQIMDINFISIKKHEMEML